MLFAGNLGRFQGLETAVAAMHLIGSQRQDIELILMGEGLAVQALRELALSGAGRDLIKFQPAGSEAQARAAMRASGAALVSLMAGIYRYAYPSKTMTYLEEGCALIAVVEAQSALARMIVNEEVGVVTAPGDADRLASAIMTLADDVDGLRAMGSRARQLAEREFAPAAVLPRWSALLAEHP